MDGKEKDGNKSNSATVDFSDEEIPEFRKVRSRSNSGNKNRNEKGKKTAKRRLNKPCKLIKKLSNKERRYKSPVTDRSSSDESESSDGELSESSGSDSDRSSNGSDLEDSTLESEINMSLPSTSDEFSDLEIENKIKERGRKCERSKDEKKKRKRTHTRSRSRSKKSRQDEVKKRRQKRKRESDSDDEQIMKIMKLVKSELKKGKKKSRNGKNKTTRNANLTPIKSPSEPMIYEPALQKNAVPRAVIRNSAQLVNDRRGDELEPDITGFNIPKRKNTKMPDSIILSPIEKDKDNAFKYCTELSSTFKGDSALDNKMFNCDDFISSSLYKKLLRCDRFVDVRMLAQIEWKKLPALPEQFVGGSPL